MILDISIAMLLTLAYNTVCVDRDDVPEKLGILTSLPHTLLSGTMTGDSIMSKQIPLTQGKFAIVDDEDYGWLNQFKWYAHKGGNAYYAIRNSYKKGKQTQISMHREILGLKRGDDRQTDHQNHCGLDNQKTNIRIVTRKQNLQNQVPTSGTSKYRGVCWHKRDKKWRAQIKYNYQGVYLGSFDNEIDAAKAYDIRAKELFGEFAYTNF